MKKQYIVKKNYQFQSIISKGSLLKTSSYFIYYLPNELNYSRFGISVGVKLGNAVTRNKIKRQIRSMIGEIQKKSLFTIIDKHRDYIIIVKKSYFTKNFDQNFKILLYSLSK